MRVKISTKSEDRIVRKAMKKWSNYDYFYKSNEQDRKEAKEVCAAAKVMLDWYGG